jgi:urea transporter
MKNLKLTVAALVFAAPAVFAAQPQPGFMSRMYAKVANVASNATSKASGLVSWSGKQIANGTASFKNASATKKAAIVVGAVVATAASVYGMKKLKQYRAAKKAAAKTTVA